MYKSLKIFFMLISESANNLETNYIHIVWPAWTIMQTSFLKMFGENLKKKNLCDNFKLSIHII